MVLASIGGGVRVCSAWIGLVFWTDDVHQYPPRHSLNTNLNCWRIIPLPRQSLGWTIHPRTMVATQMIADAGTGQTIWSEMVSIWRTPAAMQRQSMPDYLDNTPHPQMGQKAHANHRAIAPPPAGGRASASGLRSDSITSDCNLGRRG